MFKVNFGLILEVSNTSQIASLHSSFRSSLYLTHLTPLAIPQTPILSPGDMIAITIGVLALQGAVTEHLQLLRQASSNISHANPTRQYTFLEVRTAEQLSQCHALIIPGGESTTISHLAARGNLLEPLRDFVKVDRKPTWGTCAGLILLSESANRTKINGQDLIGGLDVRVNRNHFGRQTESFEADLDLGFLGPGARAFKSLFIRAPVVERILPAVTGEQEALGDGVVAPSRTPGTEKAGLVAKADVEVLARLPADARSVRDNNIIADDAHEAGDIVAVRQGNVFGTSFHPELTGDSRIHEWWLKQVADEVASR